MRPLKLMGDILARIRKDGPISGEDIGIASLCYTRTCTRRLRDEKRIHIAGWGTHNGRDYHMIFAYGPGEDAPRPGRQAPEVAKAVRRERERAKREARLYGEPLPPRRLRMKLPPPTLPTHTPRIGVWGL